MVLKIKNLQLLLLFVVLLAAVFVAPKITVDDSLQDWVPADEPIVKDYEDFLNAFHSDALLIISIVDSAHSTPVVAPATIDTVMAHISRLPHVRTVLRWPPPFLRLKTKPGKHIKAFFVSYLPPSLINPNRPLLIQQITDILDASGLTYHLAGTGVIHKAMNEETRRSTRRFLIIGLTALFVLLFAITRNIQTVLKTISISLGGVAFVFLFAYLFHIKFNMIMSILVILILFYSSSISVHILNHRGNFKIVFWPTVTAVLTTCAGFSTFLFESAPVLRHFGFLAIISLLGGFFWAIILYWPDTSATPSHLPLQKTIFRFEKFWSPVMVLLGIALIVIFLPFALRVRSEINPNSLLPERNRAIQDYHFTEENVSPYVPIEYRVDLRRVNPGKLNEWIKAVYQLDKVGAVMSYLAIPIWLNPQKLGYISRDGRSGRVTFFVPVMSTTEGLALVNQIDQLAREKSLSPESVSPPTGFVALYVSVAHHLAKSFAQTLLLAFLLVFLIMFIFLRRFKLFLAAIFPNLLPVIAVLGMMGLLHLPLDMVTLPIGCLSLGIIVDDTIHFLYWFKKTSDLHTTLKEAGPGMVVTSLIHILGFAVFLLSGAPPVRYFGILTITAMATALFGDIVMLPVILQFSRVNKNALQN